MANISSFSLALLLVFARLMLRSAVNCCSVGRRPGIGRGSDGLRPPHRIRECQNFVQLIGKGIAGFDRSGVGWRAQVAALSEVLFHSEDAGVDMDGPFGWVLMIASSSPAWVGG